MGVCNVPLVDKVCDAVGGVVSATGAAITDGIGAWIAKSMGELAAASADLAAQAVDSTTAVDLNAAWFRDNYSMLLPIGLVMIVGTFCMQLVRAAVRRDENALGQAVTGTVVGLAFMFGAISMTTVALTVVDALSAGLFQAANTNIEAAIRRIIQMSAFGGMFPLGWAIPAFTALLCAIGAMMFWAVMVFRKVAILILVTLAVFAGSGGGWEGAKRWRRGWIEATATLVVSKLLMTVVFVLGVSALGKSEPKDGIAAFSDVMAGIVILVLVLLCPMVTYKFVHWAGEGSQTGADLHGSAKAGISAVSAGAKKAGSMAMRGSGSAPPQGPLRWPGMGENGVQGGIDPSGGSTGQGSPTSYRFGAPTSGTGDRGTPLIRRPQADGDQGQALIRNATDPPHTARAPETTTPARGGSTTAGAPPAPGGENPAPAGPTVAAPSPPRSAPQAPGAGPSPQGEATPTRFAFPAKPPSS